MRNSTQLVILLIGLLILISWPVNIVRFCICDFKAPYKAEIIRGFGIPCVPIGMVVAYIPLGE
jgi:hypothetical protein